MEDMLGLSPRVPKFVKEFGKVGKAIEKAIKSYAEEVRDAHFPGPTTPTTSRTDGRCSVAAQVHCGRGVRPCRACCAPQTTPDGVTPNHARAVAARSWKPTGRDEALDLWDGIGRPRSCARRQGEEFKVRFVNELDRASPFTGTACAVPPR